MGSVKRGPPSAERMPGGEETEEGRYLGKYRTKAWSIFFSRWYFPLGTIAAMVSTSLGSLPDGWERSETVNGIPYYRK